MKTKKLHVWESALLMAAALTLLVGTWAGTSQAALAHRVLRLHVIANSDSEEDQALKLRVRDAVLEQAGALLAGVEDSAGAEELLAPHLDSLRRTAEETLARAGCGDRVEVRLADRWFPTKEYEGFALPAGEYRALQVVIGEGEGQNWWCVVFPPLCLASVSEEVAETVARAGLKEGQVALITGQDGNYVLKFKVIEWWELLMQKLRG